MNYRDFLCFDFETTSANPLRTQPVQIAAVAIHGRKLEIKKGSEFQSLMKPYLTQEECDEHGVDIMEDGALAVHGKTPEMLEEAPSTEAVWTNFTEYAKQYNYKSSNFTAPIPVGYNITGFDNIIVDRLCTKEPYNFGPVGKKGKQDVFNNIHSLDMLDFMFTMFENDKDVHSLSADNLIRGHMGYSKGRAHDAMSDVMMTAELFCKVMRMLRTLASRKNFRNAFEE